jgi:hypothetical protein
MNVTPPRGGSRRPADLARSIAWPDYDANLRLAQKTRRAVRDEVISTQEKRTRQRRNLGFAILGFVSMLVLLAPAIWSGMEDLLGEEPLLDMPAQIAFLIVMLLLTMLATLIAVWRGQRNLDHDRGGFETFRSIEK